jgi:carboxypeptidase C (cathepsin A)
MVDGGHMAPVNQGEAVNTIIENFIKGLKSPGMQTRINCG